MEQGRKRDSRSRSPIERRMERSPARQSRRRSRSPRDSSNIPESQRYGKREEPTEPEPIIEKELPDYKPSGVLVKDANSFNGVVLKYSEPSEARTPEQKFRLYVFKGKEQIDLLHVHRQSAYLFGRYGDDQAEGSKCWGKEKVVYYLTIVADIPVDHPSCSKQHAVLQFRQTVKLNQFGDTDQRIVPYIIDLESANATFVNKAKIPTSRYYELKVGDVFSFGTSTREYVLMVEDA